MDRVDFTVLTIFDLLIFMVGGVRMLPRAVAFRQLGFSPVIVLCKYSVNMERNRISWYFGSMSLQSTNVGLMSFDLIFEFWTWALARVGGPWGPSWPVATTWAVPKNFSFFFIFQFYYARYARRLRILQALAVWCLCRYTAELESSCGLLEDNGGVRQCGPWVAWGEDVRPPTVAAVGSSGDDILPRRRRLSAEDVSQCSAGGLVTPHTAGLAVCTRLPVFAYSLSVVIPLASVEQQWLVACV